MIYRRFGRTELRMPVLTAGGMRFQFKWEDVPMADVPGDNQANLEATVRRAFEIGITHFETARGYGSSERQLGQALRALPRDKILVQTKIGPIRTPLKFVRRFKQSLRRLNVSYLDMLAIHGVNSEEQLKQTIGPCGVLAVARRLQRKGLVRHVGFSSHGPPEILLEAIRHEGHGGFDYVNLHWHYIFQKNWPAIEEASRRDMGVFIISPNDKGGMLYQPPPKLAELCAPLHPMAFNALFSLSRPQVHTLSIGAARPTDYDLHVKTLQQLETADQVIPQIVRRLDQAMIDAVGADFAKRFEQGLPRWQDTPGEVNIPVILWLRNLVKAYDLVDFAKMRYKLLGRNDHWFPGNHAGDVDRFDLSRALVASPFADQIPEMLKEAHELLKPSDAAA